MYFDNNSNIINSCDILERIDELEEIDELDEYDKEELETLQGLVDWEHDETFIRDSYFVEYAQDFAQDIGVIDDIMQ